MTFQRRMMQLPYGSKSTVNKRNKKGGGKVHEIVKYVNLASGEILPFSLTKDDEYLDSNYEIDNLIDIINQPIIKPHFKIYVLFPDETIDYEIPIEDIKSGGSYNESYQNGQRRSLSFSLYNEDGAYTASINNIWVGTRLQLELGIEQDNGTIIWFHKGIFIINSVNPSNTPDDKSVNVTAQDKFSIFENKSGILEDTYEIPVGSEIEKIINHILTQTNGDNVMFDPKTIIYHHAFKGRKTQITISKNAGDSYGSILLDLATQLSAEIFYNTLGHLVIIPIKEITTDINKPLIFKFNSDNGDLSGLDFGFNMDEIINKVIVISSSNDGGFHKAIAVNDDPGSPLSVQRIGYRTAPIINDSNISSDMLAQERANYELRKQLVLKTSTTINIIFNPLLNVNNLISITDEFFDFIDERFLISSISCPLDYSGTMSVTISNITNLSFLTK